MTTNTVRWLSIRVRIICVVVFVAGSFFPPYVPKAALAPPEISSSSQQFLLVEEGFLMKTSTPSKAGERRAYGEGVIHIVKEGESLEKISNRYSINKETIQWANKIEPGFPINPGDELLILPVDGVLHTVSRGQTLVRIAQLYDVSLEDVATQNSVQGGFIIAGQELIIPGAKPIIGKPVEIASVDKPVGDTPPVREAQPVIKPPPEHVEAVPTAGVLQKPCSTECFYTQYFHGGHYAVDMQERGGGPVFAAEAGTVTRADVGWNGGYGNVIEVDHGNGLVTLYAHNKELYVREGAVVKRGQNIAGMGNTGRVYGKTGIHVHFEVRLNGVKKNPLLYLE